MKNPDPWDTLPKFITPDSIGYHTLQDIKTNKSFRFVNDGSEATRYVLSMWRMSGILKTRGADLKDYKCIRSVKDIPFLVFNIGAMQKELGIYKRPLTQNLLCQVNTPPQNGASNTAPVFSAPVPPAPVTPVTAAEFDDL